MSMRKAEGRGVRRGSGANGNFARRLSREMVEDLEMMFRGERSTCWALLIPPECDFCLPEVCARWKDYLSEHPGAAMPRTLAEAMLRQWEAYREAHPGAVPPADIAMVRRAAGVADEGARA